MTPAGAADRTTPAVVVAGDALVDLTPTTTARGGPAYEPHPGGSCLNVAVGLGRLGVPTALLARVSDDAFGRLLRAHLSTSGVLATHLLATSDPTTVATVHLEAGQPSYSFLAEGAADRGLRPEHLAELPDGGRLPEAAALHVGSIALLHPPQADTLDLLLRRESRRRLVSLDPNIRPSLVPDRDTYLRRLEGWVALADVVKASDEDLAWLYPGEPVEAVAERWLAAGAAMVLVTSGPAGARAATARSRVTVPAPAVDVVDTVGAGDAFTSGVLASLHDTGRLTRAGVEQLSEAELTDVVRFAVEVAADTCTRAGAEPPYRGSLATTHHAVREERLSVADLVARARDLATAGSRRVLGITGAPGSGKSGLAQEITAALGPELAVLVPMDGFHLSNATLRALGRRDRKGAWDTFDADGYVALLRRLRAAQEQVTYAPDFDRDVDESIGSAIPVRREVPLVVTEGSYLLSRVGGWGQVADLLDESWYLELDGATRVARLVVRHERHGMTHENAVASAAGTDEPNAELVARTRARADLVVTVAPAAAVAASGADGGTRYAAQP